ncbi:Serine/threonine protein kinase [Erythrobacter dokdonensis DSW-74]|uniref:Serine/threonine protein kinase n=2 Tax=Erythrobacter TaxID=1041 RepID=A0A1A7BL11_9SPHN|nr:Serine/threonine protein kinase [Erythrobacter dokdonensis DSW-74]
MDMPSLPHLPDNQEPFDTSGTVGKRADPVLADVSQQLDRSAGAILHALTSSAGQAVSKDILLEAGWPGRITHENSLAKAISRIRAALAAHEGYVLTAVYGQGYKLECPAPAPAPAEADPGAGTRSGGKAGDRRFSAARASAFGLPKWAAAGLIVAAIAGTALAASHYLRPSPVPATQESAEAAALMAFISEDLILPTDPYAEVPANPELRSVVERTAETMDERFAGQPAGLMALNVLVAKAFSGWGEYDRAVLHLAAARDKAREAYAGTDAELRLVEIDALACQQMRLAGQTREAEETCSDAASLGKRLQSPHRFMALVNLGKIQFEVGDYAAAVGSLDAVLARGDETAPDNVAPDIVADARWFRALALRKLARFTEAERDFAAHVDARIALNGADHPLTGWARSDYGDFLAYIGEHDRARAELAKAQAIFDQRLGPDHVESQSPAYTIALIHLDRGEPDKAEAILAPVVANFARSLGRDHFWTAYAMTELSIARAMLGKSEDARTLLGEARANAAGELFGRPAKAAWFHLRWARALTEIGDQGAARSELERARKDIVKGLGGSHPWLARVDCLAARIEQTAGNGAEAQAALDSCARRIEQARLPARYPLRAEVAQLRATAES